MNKEYLTKFTKYLLKKNEKINKKTGKIINKNCIFSFVIDTKSLSDILNEYEKCNLKTRNYKKNTCCEIDIHMEIFKDYLNFKLIDNDFAYSKEYGVINLYPALVNCNIKKNKDEYYIEFIYKENLEFDLNYAFNSFNYKCFLQSFELV